MRRIWRTLLLTALFTVLLGTAALAADTTKSGMYDVNVTNGATTTLTPQTAAEGTVTSSMETVNGAPKTFYANAVRLAITYTGATGSEECLVMVTNKQTTSPAVSDIVYIDQVAASSGTAAFNLYPSSLASGRTYYVYVSTASSSGLTPVGTFSYYAPYRLGHVMGGDSITAADALAALRMSVGLGEWTETQRLAAKATGGSGAVTAADALMILRASVGLVVLG